MTLSQNLAREFSAIDEYLKAVSDILRDGHMPDLSGLDGRVSELCTALQSADPEIQQQFLAQMSALLQKLDVCEKEIKAFHDAQIKGSAAHD
jgi:hypothetical protein